MLKKTLTYETFDGEKVTEDFYFNLTEAEAVQIEIGQEGGLSKTIEKLLSEKDGAKIVELFTQIIRKAYGKRSPDGKRFIKSDEVWAEFYESNGYSDFFMSLVTSDDAGADFIHNILPRDIKKRIAERAAAISSNTGRKRFEDYTPEEIEAMDENELVALMEVQDAPDPEERKPEDYSRQELLDMPQDEFNALLGKDPRKMSREHMVIAMQRKSKARSGG